MSSTSYHTPSPLEGSGGRKSVMTPTMSTVLFRKLSAWDRAVQPVKITESDMVNS